MEKQSKIILAFFSEGRTPEDSKLFFENFNELITNLIGKIVTSKSDIEDFRQDIIKKLFYMKGCRYNEQGKFEAWLFTVIRNLYCDECKKKNKRMFHIEQGNLPEIIEEDDEEIFLQREEAIELLKEKINLLSPIYKTVIQLFYFEKLSQAEICKRENILLCTLNKRMRVAKMKLKQMLIKEGIKYL